MSKSATAKKLAAELRSELALSLVDAETLNQQRPLKVSPVFSSVLTHRGLRRGSTISLDSQHSGALSLGLALVSEAVRSGALLAVVADETFNLSVCYDHDIPISRVVYFNLDSRRSTQTWAKALAAIIDGFELILVLKEPELQAVLTRRLTHRIKERNSVLMRIGRNRWQQSADVEIAVEANRWEGLGKGNGYLRRRNIEVSLVQRRGHSPKQYFNVTLPIEGSAQSAESNGTSKVCVVCDTHKDPLKKECCGGGGSVLSLAGAAPYNIGGGGDVGA